MGSERYYKGFEFLIQAAAYVPVPIVIAGSKSDNFRDLIKNCNNVYFLGYISEEDKVALLMLCYAVISSSNLRSEAFGISLLEGAMYGKPLISCEIGTGTTYINIHNETGIVVPPSKSESLVQAMMLMLHDKRQAKRMGLAAKKRYEELFTADKMAKSYIEIWNKSIKYLYKN